MEVLLVPAHPFNLLPDRIKLLYRISKDNAMPCNCIRAHVELSISQTQRLLTELGLLLNNVIKLVYLRRTVSTLQRVEQINRDHWHNKAS